VTRAPRQARGALSLSKGSAVVLAVVAAACGSSTSPSSSSSNNTSVTRPSGPFAFTASPMDPAFVEFIAPLGNLNPPGHTLPTDHIYFYYRLLNPSAPARVVLAPADGTVQTVITGNNVEVKLLILAASPCTYYLDHVVPDAAIVQGVAIKAGQRVGMTNPSGASFGIDLGVFSDAVTVPFANPSRYSSESLHGDSPIKYFSEPLRTQLYALVRRSSGDRDGTFNYDVAGRLIGNWFAESVPVSASQSPENWALHLAFAYDNFDPAVMRVSSGGALGFVGTPTFAAGPPNPADVSVASGKVVYRLVNSGAPFGVLIVQMTAPDRVRVEYQPGDRPDADFTDAARTYVR